MTGVPLNIDWQQILLHLFNFTILFGALYILLYKPVKNFMDGREAHYADMDSKANQALADAESSKASYEEKERACRLAKEANADFVKTSTGFSTGGATVEDVALMRKTVGPDMGVKAAGGIRDKETFEAMIKAGATRIGTSSGKNLI